MSKGGGGGVGGMVTHYGSVINIVIHVIQQLA